MSDVNQVRAQSAMPSSVKCGVEDLVVDCVKRKA